MPDDERRASAPASFFDAVDDTVRTILIGESGDGKTGALASLVAAGYQIRMHDADNGAKILKSLLLDEKHYPYASYMKSKGIDPRRSVSIIRIDCEMEFSNINIVDPKTGKISIGPKVPRPKDSKAFQTIFDTLQRWVDPFSKIDYGHMSSWDSKTVYVADSLTTIARHAYYFTQDINNRRGDLEDGNAHRRDIGGAQSFIRRWLETIYGPNIRCNVVNICHTRGVDESRGLPQSPEQIRFNDPNAVIDVNGYPTAIGIALSKRIGIYFNDSFVTRRTGSGSMTRRTISTVPAVIEGINVGTKNSAWLEPEYSIESGLAEIFAALRHEPHPAELVRAVGRKATPRAEPVQQLSGGITIQKII